MLSMAQAGRTRGSHDWEALASCRQTDPELFHPANGGSSPEATKVCRGCPVQAECLTDALANDDRFGIRAGLSARQRRRLVRQRRTRRAPVSVTVPSAATAPDWSAAGAVGAA